MLKKLIFVPILVFYCVAAEPICTNGFTLVNNKCLKLMSTTTNYNSAEQYCRGFGATLMTVKDSVENDDIKTFLKSSASMVWMGIYCITNEQCFWDDSSKNVSNYSNFATGFPLTDEGNCVYFAVATGKWISGDCDSQQRASVCEMPTTVADDCPNNFNGNCYTFHDKQKFGDAQKICQQESGNLASIISEQENRYIMSQASQFNKN
ncbi:hypothetical protein L3Y34_019491 [Caenorhabditis briggsae]|uniref:C-type lectin domain-containing protein n=1 Tax=Caenorhabditis briggsae TaxID=6238 RepID=A0AAE9IW10_CAEBR|nr:hypothetical protein L3Y34_019491 [Caenorhabditis briggsae]